MQLYNATPLKAGYTTGLLKSGRHCLVLVAKATYRFPAEGTEAVLADKQQDLFETDTFIGEPGESSPLTENDYAPLKHRCDVLLVNAHAHAPKGRPTDAVIVALQLGNIDKRFRVVGPRVWQKGALFWSATAPQPFDKLPITYEAAWGGSDEGKRAGERITFTDNPVGKSFFTNVSRQTVNGQALPNVEPLNKSMTLPGDKLPALGFGPIARNWTPRSRYGGTYDKTWIRDRRPLLPDDFDERYYQCAPADQQIDFLRGGEKLILIGLTPEESTAFMLPTRDVPMAAILTDGDRHNLQPVIDTLVIDPEKRQFTLTWRARIGLRRSIHEVDTLIVGQPTRGWERARVMDKPYWNMHDIGNIRARMRKTRAREQLIKVSMPATAIDTGANP